MTKWDYLRDFHALHPEAGSFEKIWLSAFERVYQARMRLKNPHLSFEAAQADARRVAAQSAEQEYQNQRKKPA